MIYRDEAGVNFFALRARNIKLGNRRLNEYRYICRKMINVSSRVHLSLTTHVQFGRTRVQILPQQFCYISYVRSRFYVCSTINGEFAVQRDRRATDDKLISARSPSSIQHSEISPNHRFSTLYLYLPSSDTSPATDAITIAGAGKTKKNVNVIALIKCRPRRHNHHASFWIIQETQLNRERVSERVVRRLRTIYNGGNLK